MNPYLKENLVNWISEFNESDEAQNYAQSIRGAAAYYLQELVVGAVEVAGELEELTEKILGEQLTQYSRQFQNEDKLLKEFPKYCADFFEQLEASGRFSQGVVFSRYLRTFVGRLGHQTYTRPGAKIGRNDPCPCGSGLKFKKCCQGK